MIDRPFDPEAGILKSRAFVSSELYAAELASIFRRCWLLVAPVSWVQDRGEYVTTSLGEVPVIVWRGGDGELRVFLNQCTGGQGPIVTNERGVADTLSCACHGWSYSAHESPDALSLIRVPRVEAFSGFVFACQDVNVPPLSEWMGDFVWYWDLISGLFCGGVEVVGGGSLRTRVACNWKLAAEAYSGDVYSDGTLSRATREVLDLGGALDGRRGLQIATRSGAIAVLLDDDGSSGREDPIEHMAPILATLFPNISFDGRGRALHVWHPRGVSETEVQTYCLVGKANSMESKAKWRRRCQSLFGAAGLLMQDQRAVWESISSQAKARNSFDLNLQMGLGRERQFNIPGRCSDLTSEMNQRAFYEWWQDQLMVSAPPALGASIKMSRWHAR